MKKLFPEAPDVPQSVANKAVKVVERHMRLHKVSRAKDLPEEARVRMYNDLRFLLDSEMQPPAPGSGSERFSMRRFFRGLWERVENFLSVYEAGRASGTSVVFTWAALGDPARLMIIPGDNSSTCRECG